ncbi:major facilitator superfamily domain-containing protein [Halenospora varia]|nr:major facilitator superfamily domain-containing protein [Halenospora varia]
MSEINNSPVGKVASETMEVEDSKVDMNPDTNRLALAQMMGSEEFRLAEKKLKQKLDIRLLAVMWLIFVLNYLDRNNIAAAKVAGISKTLHMSSTQYATAVALLFVGYVLMQIPSNIFLSQIRPSLYIPAVMAVWGVVSACTGIVTNPAGLYAARFFLGFVEAAFYPGALFLISSWYKRSEMGVRSAILFSATQLGSAFSGLIGAGIQSGLNGARGKPSWRWMFIIEGSITVFVALCAFWALPDWPSTTRWLTPTECAVAEWRLIDDAAQVDEDDAHWATGFKLAFKDYRLYLFAFRVDMLLLTVPPYFVAMYTSIFNNWSADRRQNSSFHVMWPLVFAIIGFVVAAASLNTGARYFAMVIMIASGHGANAVLLAWTQKTLLRPRVKRASAVAFVNAFGNISQVWTSYLYNDETAPRYALAMSVNAVFALLAILGALAMRIILQHANKKLDAGGTGVADVMKGESEAAISGVTEEEMILRKEGFRYII